jgi:hypothetical protein
LSGIAHNCDRNREWLARTRHIASGAHLARASRGARALVRADWFPRASRI